jgi:hypothetical protein
VEAGRHDVRETNEEGKRAHVDERVEKKEEQVNEDAEHSRRRRRDNCPDPRAKN